MYHSHEFTKMKTASLVIFFLSLSFYKIWGQIDPSLLCQENSCVATNCTETNIECNIQNATHSGTWLPGGDICNCCDYCLKHLREGEFCSKGSVSSPPTGTICGPGLACLPEEGTTSYKCQRMESKCHNAQDEYSERRKNGTVGFMETKPTCDGEGKFGPNKCIPGQTCFCMNDEGKRIFGEKINIKGTVTDMQCLCSRNWDYSRTKIGENSFGSRCLNDGDFDPLQCVENRCFCIRKDTGISSSTAVADLNTENLKKLPCFDPKMHQERVYKMPCEEEIEDMMSLVEEAEASGFGIIGRPLPRCQADGNYDAVQVKNDKKVCVDEKNVQIGSFQANIGSSKARNMDCKCARTYNLLKNSDGVINLPFCCTNGNWNPVQCRRGYCYCVDSNGYQTEKEVLESEIGDLSCYSKNWRDC